MALPRSPHRRLVSRLAVLALLWLALAGCVPRSLADSPVHYFVERTFEIPYSISADRLFRQLHLHVSSDGGKTYTRVSSTSLREGQFVYTAKSDGWYFFVVQVEELDGKTSPATVNMSPPGLRVCIDTEKPTVQLKPVLPTKGRVAVEWAITDKYPDLNTLRLDYRAVGSQQWIPLNHLKLERAQFDWDPTGNGPFEVRLVVKDRAGNTTTQTTQVRPDPSRPPGTGAVGGSGTSANQQVIYVNKKRFNLTYAVDRAGPSRVKHVEVWMTRDTTQWSLYSSEARPEGPAEITVERSGRYGFTLRPISGVGRGPAAPRAGDQPQVWIVVDETAPTVQLHSILVGEKEDANTITVNWYANDKFLSDQPITISYATTPDGPWTMLKERVENTGNCKCSTKDLPYEFYLRIEVTDRAGNKAHSQTKETVKVDTVIPKLKDIGVVPVGEQSNKPIH